MQVKLTLVSYSIGIVGAGVIGKRIASWCEHEADLSIRWVCDINYDRASELATNYNAKPTLNFDDLILDDSLDVIYIGIPPKFHAEFTIKAIKSGKHVLCEKPLAMNYSETREMIAASIDSTKITSVNLPLRWSTGFQKMESLLSEGYCGTIKRVELKFRFPLWPRSWQDVEWLSKSEQGGALREVGTHYFFLLGELEKYIGRVKRLCVVVERESDDLAEYSAIGMIEMTSGVLCSLNLLTHSTEEEENTMSMIGSEGILHFERWVRLFGAQRGEQVMAIIEGSEPSTNAISNLMSVLNDKNPTYPLVSFVEAARAQDILEAVLKSYGKWVELPKI